VFVLLWRIIDFWDCIWYYSRGKVRYHVVNYGDTYNAFASNGIVSVVNCYGSTPESAKEMALFKLKIAIAEAA
jgi:hypothetical protein